jgi:hypothetical protein
MEVTFDHVDFTDASTGYQSTATLTPDFGGTPTLPVTWTIVSVTNPGGTFWLRGTNDQHGLTWGSIVDGSRDWSYPPIIGGTVPTGATAELTDIVGSRTVVVRAVAVVNGTPVTKDLTVNFGPGPLSVFNGAFNTAIHWANDVDGVDFNALSSSAFGAPGACTGNSWNDNTLLLGLYPFPSELSWPSPWTGGTLLGDDYAYSPTSKLPTREQLLAVATFVAGYNDTIPRKGAALAAGWWTFASPPARFWTGSVSWNNGPDEMSAFTVHLDIGADNLELITFNTPTAACIN